MKIQEILKKAIEEEDWEILCQTYTHITGKKINPPSINKYVLFEDINNDEEINLNPSNPMEDSNNTTAIAALEIQNNSDNDPIEQFRVKPRKNNKQFVKPEGKRPNLFNQKGYNELFQDERVDLDPDNTALGIRSIRSRSRGTPQKIEVECSLCHKTIEEYPDALSGRDLETYKCMKCCVRSGARR